MKKFQFIGLILFILSACSPQPTPLPIPTFTLISNRAGVDVHAVPSATAETPVTRTPSIVETPTACKDSA